jgi:hypothetical protein
MREVMEKADYTVYVKDGIPYLPHYSNSSVYVGPGYKKGGVAYSKAFMKASGAVEVTASLWQRASFGAVSNVLNPT